MKIRIPKFTAEHFFGLMLALYWGKDILFSYVRVIILRIPYFKYVADYVLPFLMVICFACAFTYFIRSILWQDILFAGAVIIIYLLNILIYSQNEELSAIAGSFFFSVFPLYFVGLRLEPSKHFRILYIMSIINVWVFAAYYLVFNDGSFDASSAANASFMGRAYTLLPQLLVIFVGILNKKNFLNVMSGVIGFVLLLMCGNRGSVVLVLVFLAIHLLFNTKKEMRVMAGVGIFSAVGVIVYYYEMLLSSIMTTFSKFGFSIRVFQRLADGTFLKSSGRDYITEKLTSAIWNRPIIGYGLCSDRTIAGSYAHSYALELWTAFGVLFGSVILIATILIIIRAWMKAPDRLHKSFLLAFICFGFLKLFLSSSFLLEGAFFMLMGYCVSQIRVHKQRCVRQVE